MLLAVATPMAMIEPIITDDNKDEVVARVRGASRREVERLISEYRPAAALRDRIRYVQVPRPEPRDLDRSLFDRHCRRSVPEEYRDHLPTEEKVFVQFLADEEFLALFEEVRDLMGNSAFDSFADMIKIVLKEYRERHSPSARQERREKKRVNSPDSHRWEWKDATSSRHIPDEVRDAVFIRDGGQCDSRHPRQSGSSRRSIEELPPGDTTLWLTLFHKTIRARAKPVGLRTCGAAF